MIMIKKLLLASFFATILSITNYVSAHNFVPISTSGYDYLYLDTDTVNVVLYNPPSYIIDAEYLRRNASINTDTITKVRFYYDLTTKTIQYKTLMVLKRSNLTHGWIQENYNDSETISQDILPNSNEYYMANVAFKKAYGMYFNLEFNWYV